jgi:8-oxo-dGTP pyrophosphatase MutT (NUDIX family)
VPSRDFTVAVLVVRDDRILLHWHAKLGRWLPPGGHIEPDELPDEAAVREVMEETGVEAVLISSPLNPIDLPGQPRQLARPLGVQLADIGPDHQHIDLVYLAEGMTEGNGAGAWIARHRLWELELTEEVRAWCEIALTLQVGATE